MDGKVTYLPIYMWYLVKEQSIAQLIVDLDTIENNLDLNEKSNPPAMLGRME